MSPNRSASPGSERRRRSASARDIALQLLTGLYSGLPVTDEDGRVVGIITELDLINAALEGKEFVKTTAEEIMTREAITVDVATPITEIIVVMEEKNIIRLPVIEKGKLGGIIARCDILKNLIEPEFVTYM